MHGGFGLDACAETNGEAAVHTEFTATLHCTLNEAKKVDMA